MNDLDQDLRAMFRRRESDVRGPTRAPSGIERRVRHRQTRTVVLSTTTVIVVLATMLLGFRQITDRTGTYVPGQSYATRTTAHVPGIVITYPSSWQLTVFRRHQGMASLDVLSNFALDPGAVDLCAAMPPSGVMLIVEPDGAIPGSGEAPAWPVDLNAKDAPAHCDGSDGGGIAWSASGRTYGAQAFLGSGSVDTDYVTLQEAFRGMTFPTFDEQVNADGVVLASGSIGDQSWTESVHLDDTGAPRLETDVSQGGGGLIGSGSAALTMPNPQDIVLSDSVMHGDTFLVGGVSDAVAKVQIAPDGADPFEPPLLALPSGLGSTTRTFVAPMQGAPTGTLTSFDANGQELTHVRFAPGVSCWPGQTCPGQPSPEGPLARGSVAHVDWRIVAAHAGVELVDDQGSVLASADGPSGQLVVTATTLGSGDAAATFPFGIAPTGTTSVVLFTSGLPAPEETSPLPDGRVVFWGPFSPATGKGQILSFDAQCNLVGAIDLETGQPPAQPATTDCGT
jgi:hypothetical protein